MPHHIWCKNVTDNSKKHPFLDPVYIALFVRGNPTEHSRNIPCRQGSADPGPWHPGRGRMSLYMVRSG